MGCHSYSPALAVGSAAIRAGEVTASLGLERYAVALGGIIRGTFEEGRKVCAAFCWKQKSDCVLLFMGDSS